MAITITSQPPANSINAAYRPIIVGVAIVPAGPVMYCDIYFNSIFYKTISKTQGFSFDIQDAAQEYLKKYVPPAAGAQFYLAAPVITSCFVKIRSSSIDVNGFTVPDAPVPVQATGSTAAVSGGGRQSNTFYIVNATLQQEDNQNLAAHLNAFKVGNWSSSTYPLTHRPYNYAVGKLTSDFFPIVTEIVPNCVRLHYKSKTTGSYQVATNCAGAPPPPPPPPPNNNCVAVGVNAYSMPDGQTGQAYSYSIGITGDVPYSLNSIVKPSWMNIVISGNNVVLSGTPIAEGASITVSFNVENACGSVSISDSIDIAAAPATNGPHFDLPAILVHDDSLNVEETVNLIGDPNSTITVKITTLDNTNGGRLMVNGSQAFIGNTFVVPIDAAGNGSLNVSIAGIAGHPNSIIRAVFRITAVSAGVIGDPSTYQISKFFTT